MKHFLFAMALILLGACNSPQEKLIVGTYTNDGSEGIYSYDFDGKTLTNKQLLYTVEDPSYLNIAKDGQTIYSVSEAEPSKALSLVWNDDNSQLVERNAQTIDNPSACYISLDQTETHVAVASYRGGFVQVGTTEGETTALRKHKGGFENSERQSSPHAHCAVWAPDNNHLLVVDLGLDAIIAYPFESGELGEGKTALQLPEGNGMRHLVFNNAGTRGYVSAELSSMIYALDYDNETGTFSIINSSTTLPEDFKDFNSVADIHLSKDEKYAYVSNRGHNSIASFKVLENGGVEKIGTTKCRGDHPRNFVISPKGDNLLVANRDSNSITIFDLNTKDGSLEYIGECQNIHSPTCLKFMPN